MTVTTQVLYTDFFNMEDTLERQLNHVVKPAFRGPMAQFLSQVNPKTLPFRGPMAAPVAGAWGCMAVAWLLHGCCMAVAWGCMAQFLSQVLATSLTLNPKPQTLKP